MKNHYVSQFIIRRFSNAINVFDVHTGRIDESKRPHKVFYKDDIYDAISLKTCVEKRLTLGAPGADVMNKVIAIYDDYMKSSNFPA